jgi:predicted ATPase
LEEEEMAFSSQTDFRTTALDPGLLATPFSVQTNWQVMTGAPCSGKSTLIDQFAAQGFQTVPETGRLCVETEMTKGRTIDEIRENMAEMQIMVWQKQLEIERGLKAREVVFLDGALPSCLAWFRTFGLDPNDILPHCFHHRYAAVFILDPLPFQSDGTRDGDAPIINHLDEWLGRDFSSLGYAVERVPAVPVQARVELILERLSAQGLT